jgi:hypothetical protein
LIQYNLTIARVEKNYEQIDSVYFGFDCRVLRASVTVEGFMLPDMLEPEEVVAYEIRDNAEYDIRDYTVMIEDSKVCWI